MISSISLKIKLIFTVFQIKVDSKFQNFFWKKIFGIPGVDGRNIKIHIIFKNSVFSFS